MNTEKESDERPESGAQPPLLRPASLCFQCGSAIPADAHFCPDCGKSPDVTGKEESGHIAYLLRAFEGFVATGQLTQFASERMTAPYRQRLFRQTAPGITPSAVVPSGEPRPKVNFVVIWANVLLYLGAFFVVIASSVFLLAFGGLGRTVITGFLAAVFLGTGLLCRRIPIVRGSGNLFTAIGALIIPLVFLSFINFLTDAAPLPESQLYLVASISCFILYVAFTVLGLGKFYSFLSLVAYSAAFASGFAVGNWETEWLSAWWSVQALSLTAIHYSGGQYLRRYYSWMVFGWSLFWAALTLSAFPFTAMFSRETATSVWPLLLLTLMAAVIQWRQRDPVSAAAGGVLGLGAIAAFSRWAEAPQWAGSLAVVIAAGGYVGFWRWKRETIAGRELLVIGMATAFIVPFIPRGSEVAWAELVIATLSTAILLTAAIMLRQGLFLILPGFTVGIAWWFFLRVLPITGETESDLGRGFLPLALLIGIAAIVLPLRFTTWRWTGSVLFVLYAMFDGLLLFNDWSVRSFALLMFFVITVAAVARWRSPWVLAAPAAISVMLATSLVQLAGIAAEAAIPTVMLIGVGISAAGIMLQADFPRWSLPCRVYGFSVNAFAFLIGLDVIAERRSPALPEELAGHLTGAVILAAAGLLALEGRWRRLMFYPASALVVATLLWELDVLKVDQLQAYSIPAGMYLLVVAFISSRDSQLGNAARPLSAIGWFSGAMVLGLSSFFQTFGPDHWFFDFWLLFEGIALLVGGAFIRRRALLAGAITLVVLAGIRLMFEIPEFIPFILFFVGFALIGVGFIALLIFALRSSRKSAAQAAAPSEPPAPAS